MGDDGSDTHDGTENEAMGPRIAEDLSAYTSLTADFYRGEIDRMTTWRSRLDQTTNWAVVVVAAILTWAFSSGDNPHYVILIGFFGITAFLLMEANRYREYDVWRDRVRLLQEDFLADVYAADRTPDGDWQDRLSGDLRNPSFDMSFRAALNHRLRRSYMALLSILLVAWLARITVYESGESWERTASIFLLPGELVVGVVGTFYVLLLAITVWSAHGGRIEEFQT